MFFLLWLTLTGSTVQDVERYNDPSCKYLSPVKDTCHDFPFVDIDRFNCWNGHARFGPVLVALGSKVDEYASLPAICELRQRFTFSPADMDLQITRIHRMEDQLRRHDTTYYRDIDHEPPESHWLHLFIGIWIIMLIGLSFVGCRFEPTPEDSKV